ncbi:MAG: methionyl-tRNA formyltransferase [Halieaceae bacterium]|jgi:methionyl-tRNA formyltransferase|nr:methionyl-tRNA formyltransferase [Halieaceae bacterium]
MPATSSSAGTPPLRVIFAGTPEFAAIHLKALIDSEHTLIAVYTQPDRPAGRGKKLQASPVKRLAEAAGIPVYQPPSLRDAGAQQTLAQLQADLLVVVAYGLILPQAVLDFPRLGCLNVHASLLPRWRGAAPIQRAIEAGDRKTGITIMQMDAGLDTGDMLATASCEIDQQTTAGSLHDRLAELGPPLLLRVLADFEAFRREAKPQDDQLATYAGKILKSEAEIDWRQSATTLDRAIRAFNPFPICFSVLDGERVKIWRARPEGAGCDQLPGTIVRADREGILVSCGDGCLLVQRLQLPGGRELTAEQVLHARGELFAPGRRFELPADRAP